jgi:hypothetical protein
VGYAASAKERKAEMTESKPPEDRDENEQVEWYERTRYQFLLFAGGIIVYLLFGLLLWWVLDWYINPQDSGEKKDLVQALGLIMAGWPELSASTLRGEGSASLNAPKRKTRRPLRSNPPTPSSSSVSLDNPKSTTSRIPKINSEMLRRNCGSPGKAR